MRSWLSEPDRLHRDSVQPPLAHLGTVRSQDHVGAALEDLHLLLKRPGCPADVGLGQQIEHGLPGGGDVHRDRP